MDLRTCGGIYCEVNSNEGGNMNGSVRPFNQRNLVIWTSAFLFGKENLDD